MCTAQLEMCDSFLSLLKEEGEEEENVLVPIPGGLGV